MPVKILKIYKGTNIIKVERKYGQIRYGFRITIDGRKYQPAKWEKRSDAEKALTRFKSKMLDAADDDGRLRDLKISELLAAWREHAETRGTSAKRIHELTRAMKMFMKMLRHDSVKKIWEDDLLAYQKHRRQQSRKRKGDGKGKRIHPHTINKEVAMITTCLRSAKVLFSRFRWTPPSVPPLPIEHHGREEYLTPEQIQTILDELAKPGARPQATAARLLARDVVIVARDTAMRFSEILNLKKSQVTYDRGIGFKYGSIHFRASKTKKDESLPMTVDVADVLRRRSAMTPGRLVFRPETRSLNATRMAVREQYQFACERAGIPYGYENDGVVFHTLRHSTTTHLINQGLPLKTVMAITGHSSKYMTLRYTHVTPQSLDQAVDALSKLSQSRLISDAGALEEKKGS